jgi:hypothetical protein
MELSLAINDFALSSYGENVEFFDRANESEYRQKHIDIPSTYCKGCEYGSIDILLGFGGSIFIDLWDFDWYKFARTECSNPLVR